LDYEQLITKATVKILLSTLIASIIAGAGLAQTWTQTSAPSNFWISVASSADGNKLVAAGRIGLIYTSTNSGTTWTQASAPANADWSSVASSANGTKLVAVNTSPGTIYTSTDSGTTWTLSSAPSEYWFSVASSADGNKLAAIFGQISGPPPDQIYTSTNSGIIWVSNTVPMSAWASVASSADGAKLVIVSGNEICYSTNAGTAWIQSSLPSPGSFGITSPSQVIASSADGIRWVFAPNEGEQDYPSPIYVSTNFGTTWTQTSAPSNYWTCVASSADGSELIATALGQSGSYTPGPIYTSTDFGLTWTSNNVPDQQWDSVALSADGNKLTAGSGVIFRGPIYTSYSAPMPPLSIAPTNGTLAISWLVPSTNFVLEQSSDMSSWTDVTNTPILNLTNLEDQVFLPPPASNSFYRLESR
jgi:photosystem II stability/assembly factor-like uncharacterized protein